MAFYEIPHNEAFINNIYEEHARTWGNAGCVELGIKSQNLLRECNYVRTLQIGKAIKVHPKNINMGRVYLFGWGRGVAMAFQVALVLKNLPANTRDLRDMRLIPGSGRSPGRGHGNPFQYSCLENPPDRAAWQAMAHRVTECRQDQSDLAQTSV